MLAADTDRRVRLGLPAHWTAISSVCRHLGVEHPKGLSCRMSRWLYIGRNLFASSREKERSPGSRSLVPNEKKSASSGRQTLPRAYRHELHLDHRPEAAAQGLPAAGLDIGTDPSTYFLIQRSSLPAVHTCGTIICGCTSNPLRQAFSLRLPGWP